MADDLLTRDQAGTLLGMTREGVRKLEGRELTVRKRGRLVYFHRAEVLAVKDARGGARIPVATKEERAAERAADAIARERAATERAEEKERQRLLRLGFDGRRKEQEAEHEVWLRAAAARRAKEEALRAHIQVFLARTVDDRGAAELLGVTRHEVRALERKGVLPAAVQSVDVRRQYGDELDAALPSGTRYERDAIAEVRAGMREAIREDPRPVVRAASDQPDLLSKLLVAALSKLAGT